MILDYNRRISPFPGDDHAPTWGAETWGAFNWPITEGAVRIHHTIRWKVISIIEDPINFVTTLKLRQAGTETQEGFLISIKNPISGARIVNPDTGAFIINPV